ncbi:MAG: SLC13 family permease [Acidimicrobiia bacterium]|nr:SLC13 family permease [Acidimicrobiia bacterium]
MSWEAWFTLAVVILTVALMITERYPPSVVMLAAVIVLFLAGVIDASQAFIGFSSEAPIIIAGLYVLAGAAEATGAMGMLANWLGRDRGERRNLMRLLATTAGFSSIMNNTTVVAAVAPPVVDWARRQRLSPSRYLMPTSFAALLAGLVTAIGTSTNITVSGQMVQAGMAPIAFFEMTKVGLPVAVIGVVVVVVTLPWLLPRRKDAFEEISDDAREYVVQMQVTDGPVDGKTVEEAGLRHLQGVFLVEVERDGDRIAPVTPDERLEAGDRLTFAGNVEMVIDLQKMRGLQSTEQQHFDLGDAGMGQRFFEAVIGVTSSLVGETLKDADFRARYNGAVVAIHRDGERVAGKLGSVVLRSGDVLVVLADPAFRRTWGRRSDFLAIAPLGGTNPIRTRKAWWVYLVGLAIVLLAGIDALPLVKLAVAAPLVLLAFKILSPSEARQSIDLNVIVLIAAAFGLGAAVSESGLAEQIANLFVTVLGGFGARGALLAIFLATMLLTTLISHNAAAILMCSIGFATAAGFGIDARPFAIAIAVAASTDFLTPVGYQTNTMVMGLGGYRFTDFAKVGFPISISVIVVANLVIPLFWPLAPA